MRIAFVAPFGMQPKGTVSGRMLPLARALAKQGHVVRIVIPPWDDPAAIAGPRAVGANRPLHRFLPEGESAGVQVVTLPLPRRPLAVASLTYGLVRWALDSPSPDHAHDSAFGKFRPDIVHVFKPVGYSGLAGLVLQAMRVPWVLDMDDWEGPGGWADVNPYSRAEKLSLAVMEAFLPRLAGTVTVASRTLEARAWDFGLPAKRVLYMPNGVSGEKYAGWATPPGSDVAELSHKHGLADRPVLLLYTRFAEFPYWWPLDILKRVSKTFPEVKLLVVGSGFFREEGKLLVEAARMGLAEQVVVTGRVPEEKLPAYLALGDVALYPMVDNLINRAKSPVKLLEQMVAALPIVAHRVGQAPEFLGESALVVDTGDVPGMAEAASTLLANPILRNDLGQRARQRVWEQFNWERLSKAALQAYTTVRP